jgi:transcriptional regulator with XRE-family HTH domain
MKTMDAVRRRIIEEMGKRKWKNPTLAKKTNWTAAHIGKILNGQTRLNEEHLERFAKAFNIPQSELSAPTETEQFMKELETMEEMKAMFEQMLEDKDMKDILIGEWKKLRRNSPVPATDKKKP